MWSKKKIVWFVLMIATMAVIFYFSNQPGTVSREVGSTVAKAMNITPDVRWRAPANTPLLFGLDLRKWAHVFLYTCLGITTICFFGNIVTAGVVCYLYAIFDEIHQLLVIGRTATFTDTLLDECGFVLALVLWGILRFAFKRVKRLCIEIIQKRVRAVK